MRRPQNARRPLLDLDHSAARERASRPMNLRANLDALASNFASAVLDAIRGASLDELVAESGGAPRRGPGRPKGSTTKSTATAARASAPARKPSGRLARRSPADIAKTLGQIVGLVKASKTGLRSEQIRAALKLDKRELPRVLADGLRTKKLKSKGQKRATQYSAA
jgi:hypothetical protein